MLHRLGLSALTAIALLAQDRYQSSLDSRQYVLRQDDALNLTMLSESGEIVATLNRKKESEKFKGTTLRLSPDCPGGKAKIEVVEMVGKRVRMRVERPQQSMAGRMGCMMIGFVNWENFDLIQGGRIEQPAAAQSSSGSAAGARPASADSGGTAGPAARAAASKPMAPVAPETAFDRLVFHTYIGTNSSFVPSAMTVDSNDGSIVLGGLCRGFPVAMKLRNDGRAVIFRRALVKGDVPEDPCDRYNRNFRYYSPEAWVSSVAVDMMGRITLGGYLQQPAYFPAVNAFRPTATTGYQEPEGFVARFAADGSQIEYSTLVGGAKGDWVTGIATDNEGGTWVGGSTTSADFPRIGSLYDHQGDSDAFLLYLDPAGKPRFSTTIGGSYADSGGPVAVDAEGNCYFAGNAYTNREMKAEFPVTPGTVDRSGFAVSGYGGTKGFVLKLDRATKRIAWSTRFGDSYLMFGTVSPRDLKILRDGSVLVAGISGRDTRRGWPVVNDYEREPLDGSGSPGFVSVFSPDGAAYKMSKLLGARNGARVYAAAESEKGHIYVGGAMPPYSQLNGKPGLQSGLHGVRAFLQRYADNAAPIDFTGLNGRASDDNFFDRRNDAVFGLSTFGGDVIALGVASTATAPTTPDAPEQEVANPQDQGPFYFVAKLKPSESSDKCRVWTRPAELNLGNQGGQDFQVFANTDIASCQWRVTASDPWLRVKPIDPTRGVGLLKVDVETNVDPQRQGFLTIETNDGAKYAMPVRQGSVPCMVQTLTPYVEIGERAGRNLTIAVRAPQGCDWKAVSETPWVKFGAKSTGTGDGVLTLTLSANTEGATRLGFVTVGRERVTIRQGTGMTLAPPPAAKKK